MKAMILAAGLGTRLKPWTLEHPKALVPVGGVPMFERVILRLRDEGFDRIVVNVHHFADQIVEFLNHNDFGIEIKVSDESGQLLETGGGIAHAAGLIGELGDGPVLVHNVDILSDAPLSGLMEYHDQKGNDVTLLTSGRESSRKLMFDRSSQLIGWHNLKSGEYRPASVEKKVNEIEGISERAFSGIYVLGDKALNRLVESWKEAGEGAYPIMDFFLGFPEDIRIGGYDFSDLHLIDIGKPETLEQANNLI